MLYSRSALGIPCVLSQICVQETFLLFSDCVVATMPIARYRFVSCTTSLTVLMAVTLRSAMLVGVFVVRAFVFLFAFRRTCIACVTLEMHY
jgi:hypothetical protein